MAGEGTKKRSSAKANGQTAELAAANKCWLVTPFTDPGTFIMHF